MLEHRSVVPVISAVIQCVGWDQKSLIWNRISRPGCGNPH